jgi:hypothetical protein
VLRLIPDIKKSITPLSYLMGSPLRDIASGISSSVEKRLFAEYGAIFATAATPPPAIIFADADQVNEFQSSLQIERAVIGEHEIALQAAALHPLLAAAVGIAARGSISPRAADAGARSYQETVALWTRNVNRGLDHWHALGRITRERAQSIRDLAPIEQVELILDLEDSARIFFGTFFDKSILYSVAAPGASQHLSLLAFDVAEYEDPKAEVELGRHGWYRTVPNDLPHFTYLGFERNVLPDLGLTHITRAYGEREYGFWIPDLDRMERGRLG